MMPKTIASVLTAHNLSLTHKLQSQVLVKDENGNQTFFIYGLGLIGEESSAGYKSYHFDYRGSTVALSDVSGNVAERFQYGPYGELLSGNASLTPFLFVGQYGVMHDTNGLYHMRARFYSAEIRRFLNQDTLLGSVANGQGLNRFAYVNGGPIGFIDPLGLSASDIFGGIRDGVAGVLIGGAVLFGAATVLPASVFAGTALILAGAGGFFLGVDIYELWAGQNYWTGNPLSQSQIDYRKGLVGVGALTLAIGVRSALLGRAPKGMGDACEQAVTKGIAPSEVNFSQRTVHGNVEQYVLDMKAGNWDWSKSGPIRIMQQDGQWVSYDNRRLMAAQQAGLKDIPYEVVDPKAIMPGSKKTWEQAFMKRFNDRRNLDAGGAVPQGGLSNQPSIQQ
jgi:RHS repeat-associated protein